MVQSRVRPLFVFSVVLALVFTFFGCGGTGSGSSTPSTPNPTDQSPAIVVSGTTVSAIDAGSATISWTTNVSGSSQVDYGLNPTYGSSSALVTNLVTNHSVTITNLQPSTTYHFRVRSVASNNQSASSADSMFTTTAGAPPPPTSSGLCDTPGSGRSLTADPSNYQAQVSTLQAGDTLTLSAGSYGTLSIRNLNGAASNCITITGPASGTATINGQDGSNTVEIANSSYVAVKNLTIDSKGIAGAFGISAKDGSANVVHHILIDGNALVGQGASQQTVGISTKTPTWGWVIRRNRIIGAGTGLYLGDSDGSDPFVAGAIEFNLIQDCIGYCMQIKYQTTRPLVSGMPTAPSSTIIRHNVFIKGDQPSPDGDRPNLLLGGFPDTGAGSSDLYEVYGNFFFHNPREALFQASGRVTFHDNVLVGGNGVAAVFTNHDLPLKLALVYNNTIYSEQSGISFNNQASQGDAVIGNLVFAATPIKGSISHQSDNLTDTTANASQYVNAPSMTLGSMDFYPKPGQAQGTAVDLSTFSAHAGYSLDFNGKSKDTFTYRGAYAGSGTNPGWKLQAGIKTLP